jgi:hypothetical protein
MFAKELQELKGITKAYIQTIDGEYVNDGSFFFKNGCDLLRIETEKFEDKDFNSLELKEGEMIFAGVPVMLKTFEKFGGIMPPPLDIPDCLLPFCKREIRIGTLDELINASIFPIFVKPAETGKLFSGQIVSCKEELSLFGYVDEIAGFKTKVFSSEVVKIVSEFRCFVIRGEIYDCRKYKGEFSAVPDFKFIQECVDAYKDSPVAYGIDFGVTDKGETILIEANDGYSLGPYGFDCYNYSRMMILRWKELMRLDF